MEACIVLSPVLILLIYLLRDKIKPVVLTIVWLVAAILGLFEVYPEVISLGFLEKSVLIIFGILFSIKTYKKEVKGIDLFLYPTFLFFAFLKNTLFIPLEINASVLWFILVLFLVKNKDSFDLLIFPVMFLFLKSINFWILGSTFDVQDYLLYSNDLRLVPYAYAFHILVLFYLLRVLWIRKDDKNILWVLLFFYMVKDQVDSSLLLNEKNYQYLSLGGILLYSLRSLISQKSPSLRGPSLLLSFLVHPAFLSIYFMEEIIPHLRGKNFEHKLKFSIKRYKDAILAGLTAVLVLWVVKADMGIWQKLNIVLFYKLIFWRYFLVSKENEC